jgi:hypothetical protein
LGWGFFLFLLPAAVEGKTKQLNNQNGNLMRLGWIPFWFFFLTVYDEIWFFLSLFPFFF